MMIILLLNWASSLLLPHCSFYWSHAKLSFWLKLPNLSHLFRNLNNQSKKYAFPFNFWGHTIVISDALLTVWSGTLITLHSTLFHNMNSDIISYLNFILWKLLRSCAFMLPFKALWYRAPRSIFRFHAIRLKCEGECQTRVFLFLAVQTRLVLAVSIFLKARMRVLFILPRVQWAGWCRWQTGWYGHD